MHKNVLQCKDKIGAGIKQLSLSNYHIILLTTKVSHFQYYSQIIIILSVSEKHNFIVKIICVFFCLLIRVSLCLCKGCKESCCSLVCSPKFGRKRFLVE